MSGYRVNRSVLLTATRTGRLDLHGLNIEQLPEEVFSPQMIEHLQVLDISDNNFRSLPPTISKLLNLKDLIADHNRLVDLPVELCDIPHIRGISLDGNHELDKQLYQTYKLSKMIFKSKCRDIIPVLHALTERERSQLKAANPRNAAEEDVNAYDNGIYEENYGSSPRQHTRRYSVEQLDLHRLPGDRTKFNAPYAEAVEEISQRNRASQNQATYGQIDAEQNKSLYSERSNAARAQKDRLNIYGAGSNAMNYNESQDSAREYHRGGVGAANSSQNTQSQLKSQISMENYGQESSEFVPYGRRQGYNPKPQLPPFGSDKTLEAVRAENEALNAKYSARNATLGQAGISSLQTPYAASSNRPNPNEHAAGLSRRPPVNSKQFSTPFALLPSNLAQESYITSKQSMNLGVQQGLKHHQDYNNQRAAAGVAGERLAQRANNDKIHQGDQLNQPILATKYRPHQKSQIDFNENHSGSSSNNNNNNTANNGIEQRRLRGAGASRPQSGQRQTPFGTDRDVPDRAQLTYADRANQPQGPQSQVFTRHAEEDARHIRARGRQGHGALW
jgi:Leucine-rich repeat (LRR) protein